MSSRGVYKLPVQKGFSVLYDDHQCSSYDLEACVWSNIPDIDWHWQKTTTGHWDNLFGLVLII